ncbi:MAG: hypothetical protein HQ541_10120, partial [Mariniphaga sp.]|nr:hypothetical protein [Mariniphaga sp.]
VFYNAMIIFANKHFSGGKAKAFSTLINFAIYIRAIIAIASRFISKIYLPIIDALLVFTGFLLITPYWEKIKFDPGYYPSEFLNYVVPVYILIWIGGIFISKGYKKPVKLWCVVKGLFWGTIIILLAYSLVDEKYRFSRALILLGSGWAIFSFLILRIVLSFLKLTNLRLDLKKPKRIAVVGHPDEVKRVKELLTQTQISSEIVGYIAIDDSDKGKDYMGDISQLEDILRINRITELIFCAENLSSGKIIKAMLELSKLEIDYKIAPPESLSIIGSNSIHTSGDLYVVNINAISKSGNKQLKRLIDFLVALILFLLSPILFIFYKNKRTFFLNIFKVIFGKKTWVGYIQDENSLVDLPALKPGILTPADQFNKMNLDLTKKSQLNLIYAKDYRVLNDLEIIIKNLKFLARTNGK